MGRAPNIPAVVVSLALASCAVSACGRDDGARAEGDLSAAVATRGRAVWYGDVDGIVTRACAGCHGAGGIGPFPLATYDDVAARHLQVADAVASRRMPPWLPSEACQTFRGARRLSDDDVARVVAWSARDAPAGDPARASTAAPPPRGLPWTDATLEVDGDHQPSPPNGAHEERWCYALDPALAEDAMLVGYDLLPTSRSQVHHARFFEADVARVRARDEAEPGPGWSCPGDVDTGRMLGSWATNAGAVTLPEGTGVRLRAGQGLVLQVHYHGHAGHPFVPDRPRLALAMARGSVAEARFVTARATGIAIPPRTTGYEARARVFVDGRVWSFEPHMHLFGRSLRVEHVEADRRSCLLDVPRWNAHGEEMHVLERGVLVAGGTLEISCTWDNPTVLAIGDGWAPADEMCDLAMLVGPR